jgi:hypothetical protein
MVKEIDPIVNTPEVAPEAEEIVPEVVPEVVEEPVEEVETEEEIAAGQTPEEAIIDPIEGAQIHNK